MQALEFRAEAQAQVRFHWQGLRVGVKLIWAGFLPVVCVLARLCGMETHSILSTLTWLWVHILPGIGVWWGFARLVDLLTAVVGFRMWMVTVRFLRYSQVSPRLVEAEGHAMEGLLWVSASPFKWLGIWAHEAHSRGRNLWTVVGGVALGNAALWLLSSDFYVFVVIDQIATAAESLRSADSIPVRIGMLSSQGLPVALAVPFSLRRIQRCLVIGLLCWTVACVLGTTCFSSESTQLSVWLQDEAIGVAEAAYWDRRLAAIEALHKAEAVVMTIWDHIRAAVAYCFGLRF